MKRLWVIPAILAMALIYALIDGDSGVRTWLELRSDVVAAQVRIEDLRSEIDATERELDLLETDPFAMERAIREELDLARPGEVVIKVPLTED